MAAREADRAREAALENNEYVYIAQEKTDETKNVRRINQRITCRLHALASPA